MVFFLFSVLYTCIGINNIVFIIKFNLYSSNMLSTRSILITSSYMILAEVLGDTCSYLLGEPIGKYHKIEAKQNVYNEKYIY